MHGGAGNDYFYVEGVNDRVVEAVGEGFDLVYAFSSFTLEAGSEVEWLIARAPGLTITGNELANRLNGDVGSDTLNGGGGNDQIYGGGGSDTLLFGGAGNDLIYGDAGDDTLRPGLGFDQLIGGAGNDSFRFEVVDFESSATGFYDNLYDYSRDAPGANFDTIRLQGVAADYQFQTTSSPGWLLIIHSATGASIYVTTAVTADPAVLAGQVEYFA
jgi:Ca2+-binding RTX toxin-like protein